MFPWPFVIISHGRTKAFLFTYIRLYFHHALWPFIYFTHFPTKICISENKLHPYCSNGEPLRGDLLNITALASCYRCIPLCIATVAYLIAQTGAKQVVLSLTMDAVEERAFVTTDRALTLFLRQFAVAGLNLAQVSRKGHTYAKAFGRLLGIDLTSGMTYQDFLGGSHRIPGGIIFTPFYIKPTANLRVTTVRNGNQVQFLDRPVYQVGWFLAFKRDFAVNGLLRGTIPAGAYATGSSFIFNPCHFSNATCVNILNPQNPSAPILIDTITRTYIIQDKEQNFAALDLTARSQQFGRGLARGITFERLHSPVGFVDMHLTITFGNDLAYSLV